VRSYKVDDNTTAVPYETIRYGARSAVMMLHQTCPWWDLFMVVIVPLLIVSFVVAMAFRGHNEKVRIREEREQEMQWAQRQAAMNAEDESSDDEKPVRKVVKKSSKISISAKAV